MDIDAENDACTAVSAPTATMTGALVEDRIPGTPSKRALIVWMPIRRLFDE